MEHADAARAGQYEIMRLAHSAQPAAFLTTADQLEKQRRDAKKSMAACCKDLNNGREHWSCEEHAQVDFSAFIAQRKEKFVSVCEMHIA